MGARVPLYATAVALALASSSVDAQQGNRAEGAQGATAEIPQEGALRTFNFGYTAFSARLLAADGVRVWADEHYPREVLYSVQEPVIATARDLFSDVLESSGYSAQPPEVVIRKLSNGTLAKTWYGQPNEIFVNPAFLADARDQQYADVLLQATLYHEWFHLRMGGAIARDRTKEDGKRFFVEIRNLDELAARVATTSFLLEERASLDAYVRGEYERRLSDALVAPAVQPLVGFEPDAIQGYTSAELVRKYGELNAACFAFLCQQSGSSLDDAVRTFIGAFDGQQREQTGVQYLLEALAQEAIAAVYHLAGTDEATLKAVAYFERAMIEIVSSTNAPATEVWSLAWERAFASTGAGLGSNQPPRAALSIQQLADDFLERVARR